MSNITNEEKNVVKNILVTKNGKHKAKMKSSSSITFWNALRVQNGYTLKDLETVFGLSHTSISNYFIGKQLPSRRNSDQFSDLFGVPREQGWIEFNNAFDVFHNTHGKTIAVPPKRTTSMLQEELDKFSKEDEQRSSVIEISKEDAISEFLEKVYGEVSPSIFTEIVLLVKAGIVSDSMTWGRILDIAYQTVSRETFEVLLEMSYKVKT